MQIMRSDQKPRGSLGGRHAAGGARIGLDRHAQRAAEGLEHRLGLMVGVVAAQVVDVQRDAGVIDQALEEFAHQVDIELADHARGVKSTLKTRPGRPERSTTTRDSASSSGT